MAFSTDPILIEWRKDNNNNKYGVLKENEPHIVTNGFFTLNEIPDSFYKVQITDRPDMYEVKQNQLLSGANTYKVFYDGSKKVIVDSSLEGQLVHVTYRGQGVVMYPSTSIYDIESGETINTTKSLQDFLNSIKVIGWQGDYDDNALYLPNAIIYYPQEKTIYRCINLSKGNIPTDTNYWQPLISVKEASDYANSMGNYAQQQGDLAKTATQNANIATANAVEATQNANIATTDANNATNTFNNETLMIYKPYVTNYFDIATTYPTPQNGWITVVTSTNTRYRYNSTLSQWVNIDVAPYDKIGDLSQITQTNLVDGLKDKDNKIGILNNLNTQNKTDLVGAINENVASLNDIPNQTYITEKAKSVDVNNSVNNLQNQINGIGNLRFIGAYATLSALQTAFPTGTNGIALVTADGYGYYWSGSAWTKGIQFQSTGIADGSVKINSTDFVGNGKNLLNKDTVINGYYVNQTDGTLSANASYSASDYIPVSASTQYSFTILTNCRLAFYTSTKSFISGVYPVTNPITTPSNAVYIRFSISSSAIATQQLELGSSVTAYEPYGYKFKKEIPPSKGSLTYDMTNYVSVGKNLFNKNAVISGYFINQVDGTLSANSIYSASEYIPVSENTQYYLSGNLSVRVAYYNANKQFISGVYPLVSPLTTPVGTAYIRFSVLNVNLGNVQFEAGTVQTSYESYGLKFIGGATKPEDDLLVFLPSEICVAVGRTIEIYNNQVIWTGNINNYHVQWDCTIGKALKRKFSVTGSTVGTYTLTLNIYDNNMRLLKTATSTINVVSNVITPFSLLNLGDSLTNNKAWLQELINLSSNNITLVGTRGTAPTKHEGRSGFSAANYLTNTAYTFETPTETVHPFWDGTRFNWNYYKTNTGINPNAIQIFLGTNGIDIDPTVNATNIKQIVDYIRQDDANIPIFLVYTLYRGNQDGLGVQTGTDGYASNKGAWKLQEDRKVFNLMTKLNSLLNGYSNLYFIPVAPCHDSEYNFGAVSAPVNPRATQTELLPTEATHPQIQGYLQMADIMFSVIAKVY